MVGILRKVADACICQRKWDGTKMTGDGHTPGKRFALDFKAIKDAGLTRLSIPRLRAARRTLEAVGLVRLVGNYRAGSVHQTFTLARLRAVGDDGEGIVHIGKPAKKRQNRND